MVYQVQLYIYKIIVILYEDAYSDEKFVVFDNNEWYSCSTEKLLGRIYYIYFQNGDHSYYYGGKDTVYRAHIFKIKVILICILK